VITAIYARRDEPQELVDGLRENLAWADQIIEVQVPREGGWGHEGRLNALKRDRLAAAGATWTLWMDPDERLEDRAAQVLPEFCAAADTRAVGMFPLREMWTPTRWRCDGEWGAKRPRKRLFHLHGQRVRDFAWRPIHCQPTPITQRAHRTVVDVAMYHLKMIEPANRTARGQAYLNADPEGRYLNSGDWSWLNDEAGLELADIEPGRGFSPPYRLGSYQFTAPGG